jgi:hypothetical protein
MRNMERFASEIMPAFTRVAKRTPAQRAVG